MYKKYIKITKNEFVGLFSYVVRTVWHRFGFFTCQCGFIQHLSFPTTDKTWIAVNAGDKTVTITRNGETWIWPELRRGTTSGYFRGTFKTNNS